MVIRSSSGWVIVRLPSRLSSPLRYGRYSTAATARPLRYSREPGPARRSRQPGPPAFEGALVQRRQLAGVRVVASRAEPGHPAGTLAAVRVPDFQAVLAGGVQPAGCRCPTTPATTRSAPHTTARRPHRRRRPAPRRRRRRAAPTPTGHTRAAAGPARTPRCQGLRATARPAARIPLIVTPPT